MFLDCRSPIGTASRGFIFRKAGIATIWGAVPFLVASLVSRGCRDTVQCLHAGEGVTQNFNPLTLLRSRRNRTGKEIRMATISRYEFMGNWAYFWFACITIVGIPLAVLYLINGTVRIDEHVEDGERLVSALRARR